MSDSIYTIALLNGLARAHVSGWRCYKGGFISGLGNESGHV